MQNTQRRNPEQDGQNLQDTVANTPMKMWDELSIEEKIERMHEVVKQMQFLHSEMYSKVDTLISLVEQHVHDEEGKTLIKKTIREELYSRNSGIGNKAGSLVPERFF